MSTNTPLVVRPLRRTEYEHLVDLGHFEDEPIELLEGQLVEMSPEGAPHTWLIQELTRIFARGLADDLRVRIGHPWAADDISEPEPDLAVVPHGDYRTEHASTALVVIEVAHSSRAKDLGIKARIYGRAGVPAYWVMDLRASATHVHTEPYEHGYAHVERVPFGRPLTAVGIEVVIADLLEVSP